MIERTAAYRLAHLAEVVESEIASLLATDEQLFQQPFDETRAALLKADNALAEKVDAFAMRFGRLQDTVGDKLLPALMAALGQAPAPLLDHLHLAEKLGWLIGADEWLTLRRLRNRMVHEYIRDPVILADALNSSHEGVPVLVQGARRLIMEVRTRSDRPEGSGSA